MSTGNEKVDNSERGGLKKLAIKGSIWTLFGFGANNILRLIGNLLLTRLLFPEAFGLMTLVNIILQGLQMFSDIGVGPSIVQNKRGDDPSFLNTAWTIQVVRGISLWLIACFLALPISWFYNEPLLCQLIPVAALTALIGGFNSTKLFTANRHLNLGRLTIINLGSYLIGLTSMIALAWLFRSVWSLVIGGILAAVLKMFLSHTFIPGNKNCFYWDKEAWNSMFHFGKWIFMGTIISFVASQGDRMMLGKILTVKQLGIYGIAFFLSDSFARLASTLSNRVMFPILSKIERGDVVRIRRVYYRVRLRLHAIFVTSSAVMIVTGPWIIDILYDERYLEAGWILQILAVRGVISCLSFPSGAALLATGFVKFDTFASLGTALVLFFGVLIANTYDSFALIVWCIAVSVLPKLMISWIGLHRAKILVFRYELMSVLWIGLGVVLGKLTLLIVNT